MDGNLDARASLTGSRSSLPSMLPSMPPISSAAKSPHHGQDTREGARSTCLASSRRREVGGMLARRTKLAANLAHLRDEVGHVGEHPRRRSAARLGRRTRLPCLASAFAPTRGITILCCEVAGLRGFGRRRTAATARRSDGLRTCRA